MLPKRSRFFPIKTFSNTLSSFRFLPIKVRFLSVPAFVFALDVEIEVPQFGKKVRVDVSYGGAFYAFLPAKHLGTGIR